MEYFTNPPIPDNLDGSREGHGRTFLATVLKALVFVAAFLVVLDLGARFLAPFVPFSWETKLAPDSALTTPPATARGRALEDALNALGRRVASAMDLPPGMTVTIHYQEGELVNALATFGGHIIVFEGLLKEMDSEDALAAVLAHEIGHVKHRDMIKGLVRVVGLSLLLAGMEASPGASSLGEAVGGVGLTSYSRGQESEADAAAALALGRLYGHIQGVESCFLTLRRAAEGQMEAPEIVSSHPDTLKRIQRARELAVEQGIPTAGPLTPLPDVLRPADRPEKAGGRPKSSPMPQK